MNKSLTYRPEIDGLRAIAVICIILFHAGLNTFQGGFLGVDIFFVISGYLIAKIIHLDLSNNEFKFSQFYKRRIGRIVPALLFMVIGTYLVSWILFLPGPHKIVGQYAITSLLSSSNILLHIKSQDYFGLENSGNPLFHTWSLGVEEQFYAIIPILMIIGYKFKIKSREVGIIILLTSITIYFITLNNQTFNFYMMPTRAWELSLGMIAATITNPLKNKNLWITIGFIFVFLSLAFANKNSDFIFLYILFATVGTSLLLINCHQNNGIGRALSIKPLSIIGKWSYSLYLWHIPLYVFIFYLIDKNVFSYFIYAASLILISFTSYKLVELPFRNGKNFKILLILSIPSFILIIATGIIGHLNGGFPNRSEPLSNLQINNGLGIQCNGNSQITPQCSTSRTPEIAILGNSYAMVYAQAVHEQSGLNIVQLTKDSCAIGYVDFIEQDLYGNCNDFFKNSIKTIQDSLSIKTVIISSPFGKEVSSLEFKNSFIKLLNDLDGKKVIIIGPTPTAPFQVGECIYKSSYVNSENGCSFTPDDTHSKKLNTLKQNLKINDDFTFFDVTEIICPNAICTMRAEQGTAIYLDHGHLTHTGASMVIQKLRLFSQ